LINKMIFYLSTAYFPPLQYMNKLAKGDTVYIEKFENYSKQSYRNRCEIYGANGRLTLSIPIEKQATSKTKIKDVKIDYDENWQKIHFRAIESAYKNSPYFEHYFPEIEHFFSKKYVFLWDLNQDILAVLLKILDINCEIKYTSDFENEYIGSSDFRFGIHPKQRMKKEDPFFESAKYYQVFEPKHGFLENLSILDLIFNEGPGTENIINL